MWSWLSFGHWAIKCKCEDWNNFVSLNTLSLENALSVQNCPVFVRLAPFLLSISRPVFRNATFLLIHEWCSRLDRRWNLFVMAACLSFKKNSSIISFKCRYDNEYIDRKIQLLERRVSQQIPAFIRRQLGDNSHKLIASRSTIAAHLLNNSQCEAASRGNIF